MRKNVFSIVVLAMMLVFAAPSHAYFPIDISGSSYETQSSDTVRVRHIIVPGLPDKVWADFRWDPNLFVFVFVNFGIEVKPPPPPNPVIAKLELLKGHWRFIYTIQTTWTDEYLLTTILESPTNPGTFFIGGFNQYGGTVVAM